MSAANKTPGGAPPPAQAAPPAKPASLAPAECEAVRKRMPLVLVVSGGLLLVALLVAWQQGASYRHPVPVVAVRPGQAPAAVLQRAVLVCTLDADRSRNPAADSASVLMTIDTGGACVNGHTLFDTDASGFSRTAFTGSGRRVSVLRLSRDLKVFQRSDFFLERADFLRLRSARLGQRGAVCGRLAPPGGQAAALLALRRTASSVEPLIRRTPDRLMTWSCSAQPMRPGGPEGRAGFSF